MAMWWNPPPRMVSLLPSFKSLLLVLDSGVRVFRMNDRHGDHPELDLVVVLRSPPAAQRFASCRHRSLAAGYRARAGVCGEPQRPASTAPPPLSGPHRHHEPG